MNIKTIQENIGKREIKFRAWNKEIGGMHYSELERFEPCDKGSYGNTKKVFVPVFIQTTI
jgi:hypothetical protein